MGLAYADIVLSNLDDVALVRRKLMPDSAVKRLAIRAMVDSGAYMMAINETVKNQLALSVVDKRTAQLADGSLKEMDVVGPIEVRFENRMAMCTAMVIPGENECLLGAIPMGEMDVLIDPHAQRLIVNPAHPYKPQLSLK